MVATKTRSVITQPISHQSLCDVCKQKLIDLGYTVLDDYLDGSTRVFICSSALDASKTYGTIFIRFRFYSNLTVDQTLGSGYNAANKTFINPGESSYAGGFASNIDLDVTTYSSNNEYKILQLSQSNLTYYRQILGFIRPSNKPTWWNEDLANCAFILRNVDPLFETLYLSGVRPFSQFSQAECRLTSGLQYPNPLTSERDIVSNIPIYVNGHFGVAGTLPSDICFFAGNGTNILDTLVLADGKKYDVIAASNYNHPGYCIRIA